MKAGLLDYIACPECGGSFEIEADDADGEEIRSGSLACTEGHRFPIRDSVPRFVPADDYADAFALEWNEFRTAHLEQFTGLDYLERQFEEARVIAAHGV